MLSNLESPVEDINMVCFSEKAVENYSLHLHHVKFVKIAIFPDALSESPSGSEKLRIFKTVSCLITITHFLANSVNFRHIFTNPKYLEIKEKAGFVMEMTFHCATARMCQAYT